MLPRRRLCSSATLATLAALLTACGGDVGTGIRSVSVSDAQISADVAAAAGDAIAADVGDLVTAETVAGLSTASPGCPYDAASRYHVCTVVTGGGLEVVRRYQYRDASGTPVETFDAGTTASVNFIRTVDGNLTGATDAGVSWTRTVHESADVTVSGLAGAETQRVWNGTSTGSDTATYVAPASTRLYGASVTQQARDVVTRLPRTEFPWPQSGTVTRAVTARLTLNGSRDATRTVTRTAVVTFNGTATVPIVVNGLTCTLDLSARTVSGCAS